MSRPTVTPDSSGAARLAEAPTVIDSGASFDGLFTFRGSARVDGVLTGRVVADGCLVIGPRGRVDAEVEVDELVVGGEFHGRAVARARVELLSSGRAEGTLRAPSFSLAEGCVFDGRWETTRGPSLDARAAPEEGSEETAEARSAP
jgi:cytoskeletal protein CcmA (bactofilin family)